MDDAIQPKETPRQVISNTEGLRIYLLLGSVLFVNQVLTFSFL